MRQETDLYLKHYPHREKTKWEGRGSPYTDKDWNWVWNCNICGIEIIGVKDEDRNIDGHFVWFGADTDFNFSIDVIKKELSNCGLI